MNIQLLSDLHLEFHKDRGRSFIRSLDPTGVDVLILAGDISLVRDEQLWEVVTWFTRKYPHVVFVAGNHEYYATSVGIALGEREALNEEFDNFHWLENSSVDINGQRFIGATLWFPDLPDGLNNHYGKGLNDFHQIKGFCPWVYSQNTASMGFLESEVKEGDVVVTHHIPTVQGVHPRWLSSQRAFGRFFTCQMSDELLKRPAYWCYGHTHDSMAFKVGECEFLCNPLGYASGAENPDFDDHLIIVK